MKTILITGSSGFVGSYLLEEALLRNYSIYAGIRDPEIKSSFSDPKIKYFELDIQNPLKCTFDLGEIVRAQGSFDYIIHTAGIKRAIRNQEFYEVNYDGTKNLIEAIRSTGALKNKLLFMSSVSAYGPGRGDKPISDLDIASPISHYGKSKLKAENYIKSIKDLKYIIFRPGSVYGPKEDGLFSFIKLINWGFEIYVGDKIQYISLIHVKDLSRMVFDILESEFYNQEYFISDGVRYSNFSFGQMVKEVLDKRTLKIKVPFIAARMLAFIIEKISKYSGKTSSINSDRIKELKMRNWFCDNSKLVRDINFKYFYDLHHGLKESIEWYKEMGWLK